jgi:diguanylate cyclase (GGDEF)-like protein/PAS domain S-box-containing protein
MLFFIGSGGVCAVLHICKAPVVRSEVSIVSRMHDKHKTKEQLTKELTELRQRIAELEQAKNERGKETGGGAEEELRAIIDCVQDGIVLLDLTGKVITINKRITETAGYSEEDVVGKRLKLLKMFTPKSIATMLTDFARVISGQQPPPYEVEAYTKTGEKLVVEIHGSLLRKGGEKAGVVAVLRDITERKQLEALLLRERETFITILEHALYGVVLLDKQGEHIYVNNAFTEITGYTLEDNPTGRDWLHKAYPDDAYRKKVTTLWKQDRGLGVTRREISVVCKNGETKEIEFNSTVLDDGRAVVMLSDITDRKRAEEALQSHREHLEELVIERTAALQATNAQLQREITERKQMEEELRESEERFRRVVETMEVGLGTIDENGILTYVNEYLAKMLGYSIDDMIGRSTLDFYYDKESRKVQEEIFKKRRAGMRDSTPYEVTWRRKDGQKVYSILSPTPLFGANGHYTGSFAIHTDITDRKRIEEALRESEEKYRELINGMNDTAWVIDFEGNFIDVNNAAIEVLGYSREELLSMGPHDIDNALDAEEIRALIKEMPTDEIQVFETTHTTKDGKVIPVEIKSSLVTYQGKRAILSIARDITLRKHIEEELRESEERFRNLVETMKVGLSAVDRNGVITYVNEHFCNMLRYSMEEIIGRPTIDFYYDEKERKIQQKKFAQRRAGMREISSHEITWQMKDGRKLHTIVSPTPNFDKDGRYSGNFAVITDITERKQMEEALRESEERFRLLVEHSKDAFFLHGFDGKIIDVNQHGCDSLGYTREELLGLYVQDIDQNFITDQHKEKWKKMIPGEPITLEGVHRRKDGTTFPVEVRLVVLESGGRRLILGLVRDITERVRAEETIRKLAYHDSLTGLPNRVLFANRLNRAMAQAHHNQSTFAVMSLDLDRFKDINDTHGHSMGDQLLNSVGKRLVGLLRKNDTVSRTGGDEFFLLLPEIAHAKDAHTIAQKVLGAFRESFLFDNHDLSITTSIGVAMYPDDGEDADALLKHADIALYQAKQKGRNNYQHYTPAMEAEFQGQV